MRTKKSVIFGALLVMIPVSPALAHFGMIIPSDTMVMQGERKTVTLKLSFSHPLEGIGMELVNPEVFAVMTNGKKQDLLGRLKKTQVMGHTAWGIDYKIKRPGLYRQRTSSSSITQKPCLRPTGMMKAGTRKWA